MRATVPPPLARRLVGIGAAVALSLGATGLAAGCGAPAPAGTEGGTAWAGSPRPSATMQASASTDPGQDLAPRPSLLGGELAGLDCRARVHSAVRQSLFAHEIAGATTRLVEQEGTLSFSPVRLGSGGGVGDIGSGLESFVATDPQGRLRYLEIELLRENTDGPVVANVATDLVLGEGYSAAKAIGASIVGHAYGDPEVFVVDDQGRLLRQTLAARGHTITPSAPDVLATGLGNVTALGVDVFDLDGDLAQERSSASRVVVVDGDVVRQMIVHRDGSHDPLAPVLGPVASLTGATAVTRMWCSRPGGPMTDKGALIVFETSGAGRIFAGTYNPAVRTPQLRDQAVATAIPGLLAG